MTSVIACDTCIAVAASSVSRNGTTTGNVAMTTIRKMPNASRKSRGRKTAETIDLQREQPPPHALDFVGAGECRDMLRQRLRDQAACACSASAPAMRRASALVARSLGRRPDHVHYGVDEPPGEVAAERRQHHGAHLVPPGRGDRHRADDRDRHDQAEQDLRDPVDRIEQPSALIGR